MTGYGHTSLPREVLYLQLLENRILACQLDIYMMELRWSYQRWQRQQAIEEWWRRPEGLEETLTRGEMR